MRSADLHTRMPTRAISLASSSVFRLLPAPEVPTARTLTPGRGFDHARRDARGQPECDRGDVAAGDRDAGRADQLLPLLLAAPCEQELGKAVRPCAEVLAAVERGPRPAGSVSRWSAPQSMTSTSSGSCAVSAPDAPCGRARKTMSAPGEHLGRGLLEGRECASERRCGWTAASGWPAFWNAVAVVTSRSGCWRAAAAARLRHIRSAAATATDSDMGSTLGFDGTGSERRRRAKKAERVSGAASPRVGAHDGLDGALRPGVRSSCSARKRPYCPLPPAIWRPSDVRSGRAEETGKHDRPPVKCCSWFQLTTSPRSSGFQKTSPTPP